MGVLDELLEIKETEEFLKTVQSFCRKKLSSVYYLNEYDKEDITQNVLIKVYKALDKYDKSVSKASTYFDVIVTNGIKSCLREINKENNKLNSSALALVEYYEPDESDEPSHLKTEVTDDSSIFDTVDSVIDFMENSGLSEKEKKIFSLRYEGFEFQDIAQMLGYTKARISQLWKGIVEKCKLSCKTSQV
jgi:RNA polymerase sporulation-specific sigma factor